MTDAGLNPEELEAIQASIRETVPRRTGGAPAHEPTRLALIVDDRTAETARPVLLQLANRASKIMARALRSHLAGTWQLDAVSCEIVDGITAKEELRGGWVAGLANAEAELVLVAQGGVIDLAVARRCGAATPTTEQSRMPSAVALRLFQPAGRALLETWRKAWSEQFPTDLDASTDLGVVARLIESRIVVRVTLQFSGAVTGRIQVYARPEGLVPRPAALAAFRANALRVAAALAMVPVEVVVELGTLRMRLQDLRNVQPGTQFTLHGFVDSRVPVYCGGVLKAWAKPIVCRGVLAVQIESVVHGQGTKS